MDEPPPRVSVLSPDKNKQNKESLLATIFNTSENSLKRSRIGLMIVFLLTFFNAITSDLSVYQLSVPSFDELQVYEGIMGEVPRGRYNSYMSLIFEGKEILFTCRMGEKTSKKCVGKERAQLFSGEKTKIYTYRATVNGISYENRLLQLEIGDEVIISYQEQKSKYYRYKDNHFYLVSYLSSLIFFGFLAVHWSRFKRL